MFSVILNGLSATVFVSRFVVWKQTYRQDLRYNGHYLMKKQPNEYKLPTSKYPNFSKQYIPLYLIFKIHESDELEFIMMKIVFAIDFFLTFLILKKTSLDSFDIMCG